MAKLNPVRGQYILVGLDLIRAGIRNGEIIREDTKQPIPGLVPSMERWLTSRAVSRAAAFAGVPIDMATVAASVILPFIQQDPKAAVRLTEDHIVHMLGGETPVNREFARAELYALEIAYGVTPTVAAPKAA